VRDRRVQRPVVSPRAHRAHRTRSPGSSRQADYRARRKRAQTAATSSRWAGAITRTVEDQYQLGLRALGVHMRSLDAAIETLQTRCALAPTERDGKITGYRGAAERFMKTRRLAALRDRAEQTLHNLTEGRPVVVVGGKRLWRNRNHLAAADVSEHAWRQGWDAARMFLTADGETGKTGGNEPSASHRVPGNCASKFLLLWQIGSEHT
jgi:hypothetical protein